VALPSIAPSSRQTSTPIWTSTPIIRINSTQHSTDQLNSRRRQHPQCWIPFDLFQKIRNESLTSTTDNHRDPWPTILKSLQLQSLREIYRRRPRRRHNYYNSNSSIKVYIDIGIYIFMRIYIMHMYVLMYMFS
jgi:hypothetical protein